MLCPNGGISQVVDLECNNQQDVNEQMIARSKK